MADKKISELPLLNSVSGSSMIIPVVHDGTTTRVNLSQIGHYASQWSAQTGSANTFTGTQTINGNVNISGRLTVHEIVANYETSSILFSTGSTKLGDQLTDIHEFTGSTNITGSFYYNNVLVTNIDANTVFKLQQATASIQSATSSLNQATSSLNFASGALEIASGSYNRFYQATQSLHLATQSLNYFYAQTSSQDAVNLRISSTTGSINTTTSSFDSVFLGISSVTGAMNTTTSSFDSVFLRISSTTGSINVQSSSQDLVNRGISSVTGSINTTTASFDSVFLRISSTTGSINATTSSFNSEFNKIGSTTASIHFTTGALNAFTGSVIGQTNTISTFTSSVNFTTQSLNTQTGSQDLVNRGISSVTGSINTTTSSFDLVFRGISSVTGAINLTTSSLIGITNGLMAFTAALDNTYATDAQLYQLYQATASIHSATASLNTQTGSQANLNAQIGIATSSLNTFSGSIRSEINLLEDYTASLKAAAIVSSSTQITNYYKFAETASANTFYGNQTFNNDVRANKFVFTDGVVSQNVGGQNIIGTSGNILYLYTGTSGLYINNQANNAQNVTISDAGVVQTRGALTVGSPGNDQNIYFGGSNSTLDWASTGAKVQYSVGALQFSSVGTTNNMILQQQAGALFNAGITGSLMATNGVVSSSAQLPQIAGLQEYTASLKGAIEVNGQNVNVLGMITAQQFNVTYVSSSVMYQSGSTKVGNTFDDKHEFTGSVKISGSFEVQGTDTGASVGDLLVDSINKYVYVGRQSVTSGDNTTLVLRDRTGTARATLPAGGSYDTIFTTNASNFKITNYGGTNLLNVSNLGNVTASGTFRIDGQTQIGTATTDTSLGSNTKLKVVGDGSVNAGASQGSLFVAAGNQGGDTGLPINMGTAGATALLLASINTSTGTATNSATYIVRFYFDGNNAPTTTYLGGSSDFVTFGVTPSNTLAVSGSSSGNKSYAWFINKFGA